MKLKYLDIPPYTVDSNQFRRFEQRQTVFGRRSWDTNAPFYQRYPEEHIMSIVMRHEPGYTRRDYARAEAAWTVKEHFHGAYGWERLGSENTLLQQMGRYSVSDPAEMTHYIKVTARMYGADLVGVCRLDRRWVYAADIAERPIDIPPSYRYAIVMGIAMDTPAIMDTPTYIASAATGVGYSRMAFTASCLAQFIRNLGYSAISMGNDTALSIPLAIDAGLGELGRNGLLITPEYGPCVRLCKIFTDIPLKPDKPISFGLAETCRSCRRCADACEAGAISTAPSPSYDIACPSNNAGILRWAVNQDKCYMFWLENGGGCSTCIASCPFTQHAM